MQRFDATRIDRATRLANGSLRVDARPTRTGVLTYRRTDGSTVRELRHPDEVFSPESLASLRAVPLTVQHPSAPVDPSTWQDHAVGHVGDDVRRDGSHVAAQIVVAHGPAIEGVQRGANGEPDGLTELSCGYTCDIDETPGTYNGEPYDCVQRQIRYNHVAALSPGQGRAGPSASFRFDAASAAVSREEIKMGKVTVDGIEYDKGSDAHVSALEKRANDATTRADTAAGQLAAVAADLAVARDPKRIAAEVQKRTRLVADAMRCARIHSIKVDAAEEAAGASDPYAMIRGVLAKIAPGVDLTGASDDFVMGVLMTKLQDVEPDGDETAGPVDSGISPPSDGSAGGIQGVPNNPKMDSRNARAVAFQRPASGNGRRADAHKEEIPDWKRPLAASVEK